MKLILALLLSISTFSSFASVKYECETPLVSNRVIYSEGSLLFTDTIMENGQRVLTDILAQIRAGWDKLPDDECYLGDYCGEFESERLEENLNYNPRIYTNHSQFLNFNSQPAGQQMRGELIVEKKTGQDQIKAHYVFQAGGHIGGVVDFYCSKVD